MERASPVVRADALTHGDQGNPLVLLIARHALGARIVEGLAIHQKLIAMMAVVQRDSQSPPPVRHPVHGIDIRLPVVEIAHDAHLRGIGSQIHKIHHAALILCGIALAWLCRGIRF